MPVIFSTPTSHRVFMLNKDAKFMLEAMQTSGSIPSALFPEDLTDALVALQNRISLESDADANDAAQAKDSEHVEINTKAGPLIELIQRAIAQNEKLMWDNG